MLCVPVSFKGDRRWQIMYKNQGLVWERTLNGSLWNWVQNAYASIAEWHIRTVVYNPARDSLRISNLTLSALWQRQPCSELSMTLWCGYYTQILVFQMLRVKKKRKSWLEVIWFHILDLSFSALVLLIFEAWTSVSIMDAQQLTASSHLPDAAATQPHKHLLPLLHLSTRATGPWGHAGHFTGVLRIWHQSSWLGGTWGWGTWLSW